MNALEIMEKLGGKAGQNVCVAFRREAKTRKTNPPPFRIEKQTCGTFRAGINYENRAAVQDKRESGIEAVGLIGKRWAHFPYILQSEKAPEKLYLRLNPTSGTARPFVQWFADGKPVALETVAPYLLASETAERETPQGEFCFDIGADNVLFVGEKVDNPAAYL